MKLYCFIFLSFLPFIAYTQAGGWIWIKGDSFPNGSGNYGIMGVPSPTNEPPPRYAPAFWTDTDGNFWLYGGVGYPEGGNKCFYDLWKFDLNTMQWTWMNGIYPRDYFEEVINSGKGVFDSVNSPGPLGFGVPTWTDKYNHLWLYGGIGDLTTPSWRMWQYDPAINQWAWMQHGLYENVNWGQLGIPDSTNNPGGRYETNTTWIDSAGNLWLFGGTQEWDVMYNDVWKYNCETNIWTWMSGGDVVFSLGNYGPLGDSSVNYAPSARYNNFHWQDEAGNFWLIGGGDLYPGSYEFYDDVWKFNPYSLEWTRYNGNGMNDTVSTSTSNCSKNTSNEEGGRYENRAVWKLSDCLLINYGGTTGFNETEENDLWAYLVYENKWVKINEWPDSGAYGTQGIFSGESYPHVRIGSCGFLDKNKNLWMFGGGQWDIAPTVKCYNDLWEYIIDTSCLGQLSCNYIPSFQSHLAASYSGCSGACNGYAEVTTLYGTPPYKYFWEPTGDTTNLVSNLCPGLYKYKVTDAAGLITTDSLIIPSLLPLVANDSFIAYPCFNTNATIMVYAIGGSPPYTGGGSFSVAPGNYGYLITDINGCHDSVMVTVPQVSQIHENISAGNISCYGDSTGVIISATGGVPPYNGPGIGFLPAGQYVFNITDSFQCKATGTVTLGQPPQLKVNILGNDSIPCNQDSALVIISATGGTPPYNGIDSFTVMPGLFISIITDSLGCKVIDSTSFVQLLPPTVTITANTTTICPSDSAQICAPSNFPFYTWNNSATGTCIEATGAGNYYVTVTDNNGCTAESNHVGITALQSPPISISRNGDTLRVYFSTNIQWFLNNDSITGATQNIYIAHIYGTYSVSVTDSDGCTTFSSQVFFTGIENVKDNENIFIFPNPLSIGSWQLTVSNNFIGAQLEILDDNGRVVYKSEIKNPHSEISAQLAGGVYLLRITTGAGVVVRKLVKL